MIAYLLKNWKLLLDIVIVVAGIILFTLFDPFGMFSSKNLRNTANLVSSVKDIGELVTAEYYGEVISSLNETYIFDLPEDTITEKFEECFYKLKKACWEEFENTKPKDFINSDKLDAIRKEYNASDEYIYNHLIVLLAINWKKPIAGKYYKEKKEELKGNTEQKIIEIIFDDFKELKKKHKKNKTPEEERELDIDAYINKVPSFVENSAFFHYELNKKALKRKHDIVFIGRGWVKAGFKFDKLDERNFTYDKSRKTIRFYGLSPEVLAKDINPWFIPENKIKGFELVDFYRGATFEEAKIVKKKCKEKLLDQAQNAGLMEQAQKNGEVALKNFFSLLLDEPELEVAFDPLPYQSELNLFKADTLITASEAIKIDSIFQVLSNKIKNSSSPEKEIHQQKLQIFYNQIVNVPFIDTGFYFNMYSISAAKILKKKYYITKADYDSFHLNVRDRLRISEENNHVFTNFTKRFPIHFEYPEFVSQFNNTLKLLDSELEKAFKNPNKTIEITSKNFYKLNLNKHTEEIAHDTLKDTLNNITYTLSHKSVNDSAVYVLTRESNSLPFQFYNLNYPQEFNIPERFSDTLKLSELKFIEPFIDKAVETKNYTTGNPSLDSIRKQEINKVLKTYELERIENKVRLKPINKFISLFNNQANTHNYD